MNILNLKEIFLLVKTSSFDHTNIWSLKMRYGVRMDDPVHCLAVGPLLPYIHFTSI